MSELLSARDAAERLGVKRDTLYAYVSRGLLHSVAVQGSRERHYRAEDVERFRLGRGLDRGREVTEALMPVIGSSICLIENGRLYYRGVDAIRLAETATLEGVAGLLWNDDPGSPAALGALQQNEARDAPLRAKAHQEQRPLGVIERCQVRLAEMAATDFAALDLGRSGVIRSGSTILSALISAITAEKATAGDAHERLAAHWRLDGGGADLVRRALILLADHELNASTFVARCVASTGATPYAVVSAALSALSGRLHGGASARAEALLLEIGADSDPLAVMAARLARNEGLPGIGHILYPDGDPRATAIFAATIAALPQARPQIEAAIAAARQLTGKHPNIDFALGAMVTALGLPSGAALSLFIVGRTVGWIAHAIEQYESRVLIRPRARYTGRRPGAGG
jgi:citrate synthase